LTKILDGHVVMLGTAAHTAYIVSLQLNINIRFWNASRIHRRRKGGPFPFSPSNGGSKNKSITEGDNMPAVPADEFRWADIDQRLLSHKISEVAEEMHKRVAEGERKVTFDARQSGNAAGYLPRLFDFHEQLTDEWAKRLYTAHCEAWVQQNRTVSAAFIRAVRDRAIIQLIAVRKSSVQAEACRRGTATSQQPNSIALGAWNRKMNRLAARWNRKLEAEAVATEYRASNEVDDDRRFALMAIAEARKSTPEDGKPRPKVGAVVVKDGKVLATAHRGEAKGNHAEYIALEKKLTDAAVSGATVYTTLEPCTTRNPPKVPCVERIIARKIRRVVIGMLDPDPRITGRGQRSLRNANIITDLFPHDLMAQVEDLNREFTKDRESLNKIPEALLQKPDTTSQRPPSKPRELDLPAARPVIVPKRYGAGVLKNDMGYTGLAVVNDGEPAYDLTISSVRIKDGARLNFHHGHTERLTKNDGEAFYPCFIDMKLGGTFGSGLFDFMRERGIKALTVPITYRDFGNCWFQTDITLMRDVEKSGGLRLGWLQKRISDPTSDAISTSPVSSPAVTGPAQAMTRNVETVLSVMTERKNWKRTDLAKLANISDDDALQALRALKDADKVIPIDVDEEPKGTFWRRI
jgi:pyrimidine deaminase RibD-like protein